MTEYIRLSENYNINSLIPISSSPYTHIKNGDKPHFISMMKYNEEQYRKWKDTNTLSGMKGSTTNKLWADFDSKNLQESFKDCQTFVERLLDLGFDESNIQVSFSGNKGTGIIVETADSYTIEQVKAICTNLAQDLPTFDRSMYDHQRIFRLLFTKNEKTGLYKVPLTISELNEANIDDIKANAKDLSNFDQQEILGFYTKATVQVPKELLAVPEVKTVTEVKQPSNDDVLSLKPPTGWKLYKWALAEGFFDAGERNHALTIIAATCRGMGYDKETTYYLCKSALKKQAARTGTEEFAKEELWKIIDGSVFSTNWQGGQFSPKSDPWLAAYCKRMGINVNTTDEKQTTDIIEAFSDFKNYALNIDDLTIKTGIPELDRRVRMTVGMSLGLVASPGVGKTSFAIQLLNNMSISGERSIFFSYDMYGALVIQKLVQRHFGISSNNVFKRFQEDKRFHGEVLEKLKDEYKNVDFCFKTGQTVEDMLDTIKESEDKSGEKIKFMVMDYNELVITDKSDPTQSSAYVAQKMRELATTQQMAVLSLFQPSKMSGLPSDEIKSYHSAKGSSAIAQSVSVMLGMSRPGFNPRKPEHDIFTNLACLKNRMGELFSYDFHFDGLRGMIREMSEEERVILNQVREAKAMAESSSGGGWD